MRASSVIAILKKNLMIDVRRAVELLAAAVFSLAAAVAAAFASTYSADGFATGVACLMLIEVFIAVYSATTSFVREEEKGTLDGLKAAPIDPAALFLAELLHCYFTIIALTGVAAVLLYALSNAAGLLSLPVILVLALLGVHLAAAAALSSAIAVYVEARGILIPMLLLVFSAPAMIRAVDCVVGVVSFGSMVTLAGTAFGFSVVTIVLASFVLE